MRFEKVKNQNNIAENGEIEVIQEVENKVAIIQQSLMKSPEVIKLSKNLNIQDKNAVMAFGEEPAVAISKFADSILANIQSHSLEESGVMLRELAKVMKRFDKTEIAKVGEGFMERLFHSAKKTVDKIFEKYQTLGGEIDKIHCEITSYKVDIIKTNEILDQMYKNNFEYYESLEKYTVAGQMILKELREEDLPYYKDLANSGEQKDILNLNNLNEVVEMIEQRIHALESAKMVSLQTAPMIKLIQRGNYKLIEKIQSAFIITIPIFKNALIEAVTIKRQKNGCRFYEGIR